MITKQEYLEQASQKYDIINNSETKVHEHGFVRLVDYFGDDARIVQAARVSYKKGTKSIREDTSLVDYLLRHKHWSPFEKVVFEFHVKLPIFLARQWMRHRDSFNEISGRYSELTDEFFVPDNFRMQSKTNKQGSEGSFTESANKDFLERFKHSHVESYERYELQLQRGLAREQARAVLPLSTYTEFYWTVNLRSLMNFINLRDNSHAQEEIQDYAKVVRKLAEPVAPVAFSSFNNHVKDGINLSADELRLLKEYVDVSKLRSDLNESNVLKGGRKKEFMDKVGL